MPSFVWAQESTSGASSASTGSSTGGSSGPVVPNGTTGINPSTTSANPGATSANPTTTLPDGQPSGTFNSQIKKRPRSKLSEDLTLPPQLSQKPTAPPQLTPAVPSEFFLCPRLFLYRGKVLNCDSSRDSDGEVLRPIVQDEPEAIQQLDLYQQNRREVNHLAYWTTAGLALLAIAQFIVYKQESFQQRVMVRNIVGISGAALAAGSFIRGLVILRTNEAHLGNAVDLHNKAHPNDPIELQFTTGFRF